MIRLAVIALVLLTAHPAQAGKVLALRCAAGGFETQVMEGKGFAEATLGLERTPLWCPDQGAVETAWVAGDTPIAQDLARLAASPAGDGEAVTVGEPRALRTLRLTTVGALRARLATPVAAGLRFNGATCQPLRRYHGQTDFPPCRGSRLEAQVMPRVWD